MTEPLNKKMKKDPQHLTVPYASPLSTCATGVAYVRVIFTFTTIDDYSIWWIKSVFFFLLRNGILF